MSKYDYAISQLQAELNSLRLDINYAKQTNLTRYEILKYEHEPKIESLEWSIKRLQQPEMIRHDEFVGLEIQDGYCEGFFGGQSFGYQGAIIVSSGKDFFTVRRTDGKLDTAYFDDGWEDYMREAIYKWCKVEEEEG